MKLYDELVWRGLIQDISDDALIEKLNNGGLTFYIGTDPTADSMHIGHYSSFLIELHLHYIKDRRYELSSSFCTPYL